METSCKANSAIKKINPVVVKTIEFFIAFFLSLLNWVNETTGPVLKDVALKCSNAVIDELSIFVVRFNAKARNIEPIIFKTSPVIDIKVIRMCKRSGVFISIRFK